MVKKKKLKEYLHKHLTAIENNLKSTAKELDTDTLHDLRLGAKKVKAISYFLHEALPGKDGSSTQKLKKIFRTAGDIRTAQLNLEAIEKHKIKNSSFKKNQQKIIRKNTGALVKNRKDFKKDISKLHKDFDAHVTSIKKKTVIAFFHDHVKALNHNFKEVDEATLHESRKIIKKLIYVMKLLPQSVKDELHINSQYLNFIQDVIGQWHDAGVTLILLRKSAGTTNTALASLVDEKEKLLQKVIDNTKHFLHSLRSGATYSTR